MIFLNRLAKTTANMAFMPSPGKNNNTPLINNWLKDKPSSKKTFNIIAIYGVPMT